MTIDELIKRCDNDPFLLGAMQELAQLRQSQMQPAVRYLDNSLIKQWNHVLEEVHEVRDAYWCHINSNPHPSVTFIKEHLVEELIDLQFSCQTMMEGPLQLTKSQIADSIQKVVAKNKARGYYK